MTFNLSTIDMDGFEFLSIYGAEWDDLFRRSDVSNPFSLSTNLRLAIKEFWPNCQFRIVAIKNGHGRFVAALPLIENSVLPGLNYLELPNNEWGNWGDLLIDSETNVDRCCSLLAVLLQNSTKHFAIKFKQIDSSSHKWRAMTRQLENVGKRTRQQNGFFVGMVDHAMTWGAYEDALSKSFRKMLKRNVGKNVCDWFHSRKRIELLPSA